MLAGEHGPARQWAIRHQVAVGEFFDAPDFVGRRPGAHHGRHREPRPVGRRLARGARRPAARAAARAHPHHHRSARPRLRQLQAPQADAGHGRHRGARHCRLRGARRADDQHLHQLPDHHAAGQGRAPGDGRHRRRHLLQQRAGRAQQLRGRALGAGRGPHRPHAALRLSPRPAPRRQPPFHARPSAARSGRLGRARRHRRQGHQQLLGGAGHHRPRRRPQLRRDEAFRRRAGELRLGCAVPYAGHDAGGAHHRRGVCRPPRAAGHPHRARPISRPSTPPTRRPATRPTWWCSPRRSCRSSRWPRWPTCSTAATCTPPPR